MKRAVVAALLASGCSFIEVRGPGSRGPTRCTNDYTVPAADTVVVGVMALVGYLVASSSYFKGNSSGSERRNEEFAAGASALILGLPWYTSATYGYITVARCNCARSYLASGSPSQ